MGNEHEEIDAFSSNIYDNSFGTKVVKRSFYITNKTSSSIRNENNDTVIIAPKQFWFWGITSCLSQRQV